MPKDVSTNPKQKYGINDLLDPAVEVTVFFYCSFGMVMSFFTMRMTVFLVFVLVLILVLVLMVLLMMLLRHHDLYMAAI